jgi:hypothetical protein
MSATAASSEPIEQRLHDNCLGTGDPSGHRSTTALSRPARVRRFDELLAEAKGRWVSESSVPRPLAAAQFFASFFPENRYSVARGHLGRGMNRPSVTWPTWVP